MRGWGGGDDRVRVWKSLRQFFFVPHPSPIQVELEDIFTGVFFCLLRNIRYMITSVKKGLTYVIDDYYLLSIGQLN